MPVHCQMIWNFFFFYWNACFFVDCGRLHQMSIRRQHSICLRVNYEKYELLKHLLCGEHGVAFLFERNACDGSGAKFTVNSRSLFFMIKFELIVLQRKFQKHIVSDIGSIMIHRSMRKWKCLGASTLERFVDESTEANIPINFSPSHQRSSLMRHLVEIRRKRNAA